MTDAPFQKLLVPLDGTSEAAVALPLARALAQATRGEILLLRIHTSLRASAGDADWASAQQYLSDIARELRAVRCPGRDTRAGGGYW